MKLQHLPSTMATPTMVSALRTTVGTADGVVLRNASAANGATWWWLTEDGMVAVDGAVCGVWTLEEVKALGLGLLTLQLLYSVSLSLFTLLFLSFAKNKTNQTPLFFFFFFFSKTHKTTTFLGWPFEKIKNRATAGTSLVWLIQQFSVDS